MNRIISLSTQEQKDIFEYAAQKRKIPTAMIEKDFWVCLVLDKIFLQADLKKSLRFKGGTSLSKVFNVIERFSEDIDLTLDSRKFLKDGEELICASYTKQKVFNEELRKRAKAYISTALKDTIASLLGDICSVSVDEEEQMTLTVRYQKLFSTPYIGEKIKLEFGLGAWTPHEEHVIQPYISQADKKLSNMLTTSIPTITAERTFWEKATILHREYNRLEGVTPRRYSRHYYDLFKMGQSKIKSRALSDLELLQDVAKHKDKFYHCSWAKYDEAKQGTLHLYPAEHNMEVLSKDYKDMEEMIFDNYPSWDEILKYLKDLEDEINQK